MAMDDMERFATTALLLLVIVRLVKEIKGVLEPLPRWPAGADPASIVARKGKDGSDSTDWLTPEEEFERWAKGGARPGRKRLLVSVSQAVLALLAVPVWWRTTAIVRAPVPVRAIATETATPPLAFAAPVVHVTLPRDESPSLVSAVLKGAARCTAADVRVTAHPGIHADWLRELAGSSDLDVDQWANSRGDDDDEYDYRLMFLPSEDDEYVGPGTTLVMGTGRAAWARLRAGADDATTTAAADAAVCLAAECFVLGRCGPDPDASHSNPVVSTDPLSPLTPDGRALLSFTLANASPDRERGHVYSWRFGPDVEHRFLAHASSALKRLGRFDVEGQVLYHAKSAGERPRWDEARGAFVTPARELPFFVDSEWSLDTSAGELGAKPLHFVVYAPPADECPLLVLREDDTPSPANGFVVPGWGGVVVWNPPTCGGGGRNVSDAGLDASYLAGTDLERVMEAAVGQLRQLLGLSPSPPRADITHVEQLAVRSVPASPAGFATWEVDALVRRRAAAGHRAAMDSLDSLAAVVKAMPEMDVPKALAEAVGESLVESKRAREAAEGGMLEDAAHHARNAHAKAESAFFHPQIISLLYFPAEYKLAVYIPLFLPTLFPLFTGLMWDVKFYVRRMRCAAEHRRRAGKAD